MVNYYKIGGRIRHFRKARGLSQEKLAERVNVSTAHISHLETGNTKLSLAVLVDIAAVLETGIDELVVGSESTGRGAAFSAVAEVTDPCTTREAKIIAEILKSAKQAMDQYEWRYRLWAGLPYVRRPRPQSANTSGCKTARRGV